MRTATAVPIGDRRVRWKRFDPADVELLPREERRARSLEVAAAAADDDGDLVEVGALPLVADDADRAVRERQVLRVAQETIDGRRGMDACLRNMTAVSL